MMGLTATAARERERAVQTQPFPQPMGEKLGTECMAWLLSFAQDFVSHNIRVFLYPDD